MRVTINGEQRDLRVGLTVRELIELLELGDAAVAIAVNREFVPRSEHTRRAIQPGDALEIVAPMQGG